MKKIFILLLICSVVLSGCSLFGRNDEEEFDPASFIMPTFGEVSNNDVWQEVEVSNINFTYIERFPIVLGDWEFTDLTAFPEAAYGASASVNGKGSIAVSADLVRAGFRGGVTNNVLTIKSADESYWVNIIVLSNGYDLDMDYFTEILEEDKVRVYPVDWLNIGSALYESHNNLPYGHKQTYNYATVRRTLYSIANNNLVPSIHIEFFHQGDIHN